ncbi:hypothetical protein BsWGS_11290 [Bradybaena similaris]
MASPSSVDSDLLQQFIAVTGAEHDVAVRLLEVCAGNLDLAVDMHMDNIGHQDVSNSARGEGTSSGNYSCEDNVRAPIPQRTEVLVEDSPLSAVDHSDESANAQRNSKKRSLEDLFRPPVDITFKGTFQNARDVGSAQNKWLLVNVQNVEEFSCQMLNRDVWSHADARNIIGDSFLFWQVYNDSEEGKRFMQFYKLNGWPYVAIIDPVTGEKQLVWNKIADGQVFCDLAKDFLSSCPAPDQSLIPSPSKRLKREPSILDASEKEQMEAAIQASLVENAQPAAHQYVFASDSEDSSDDVETFSDPDEIIFSTPPGSSNGVSQSRAPASSGGPSSCRSNSESRSPHLRQCKQTSHRQGTSLSSSAPSTSNSTSSPVAGANIRQCNVRTNSEIVGSSQAEAASSGWPRVSPLHSERDSPLEVNIESSLIDMIGCREAEVGTPDTLTQDDSPSDSQLSAPDRDTPAATPSSSGQLSQGNSWTDYLGHPSDPVSSIIIRFPNNTREQVQLPCSSQLQALILYCSGQGFPADKYELVTNYPRRRLSDMASSTSLQDAGLHSQETVFVQDI